MWSSEKGTLVIGEDSRSIRSLNKIADKICHAISFDDTKDTMSITSSQTFDDLAMSSKSNGDYNNNEKHKGNFPVKENIHDFLSLTSNNDGDSSNEDSVCTECKFVNNHKLFDALFQDEQKPLLKRSISAVAEGDTKIARKSSLAVHNRLKTFKFEGLEVPRTKYTVEHNSADMRRKKALTESESQSLVQNSPSFSGSTFSQSTVEEIHHIDEAGDARRSENGESLKMVKNPINDTAVNVGSFIETDDKSQCRFLRDISVLEITVESDMEEILKEGGVVDKRKAIGKNVNSIQQKIAGKDDEERRNALIDLTTLKTAGSPGKCIVSLKYVGAENGEEIGEQKRINFAKLTGEDVQDDLSLELLTESQLQSMEKEAYAKTRETSRDTNVKSVSDTEHVFYKPERRNIDNENDSDYLALPGWVTNPAPEPDYDKIRRKVQARKEYVRKMLREILRLSTIVRRLKSCLVGAEDLEANSKTRVERAEQIQECPEIPRNRNKLYNPYLRSEVLVNAEKKLYPCPNASNTICERSDIFYTPQTSRSKLNEPGNFLNNVNGGGPTKFRASAHPATNNIYLSRLQGESSKVPPIFNSLIDTKLKRGEINAANIFTSLKGNSSHNFHRLSNDTGFYSPNKSSVPLNNYTELNGAINNEILARRGFGNSFTASRSNRDDSIFYSGIKEGGTVFRML